MKKITIVIIIALWNLNSFCQNTTIQKLIESFGEQRVQYLTNHYPDSLEFYKFVLENGFQIISQKYIKTEKLTHASTISLPTNCLKNNIPQPELINIFSLPVSFSHNQNNYYYIQGTDYILSLRSKEYLQNKFNAKPIQK